MKQVQLDIVLGTIFVILSSVIIIIMGVEENDRLADYENTQRAELIEFGAKVFETNCTNCHGDRAQGVAGRAPCLRCEELFTTRIDELGWQGSLEDYVVSIVTTGRQVSTRPDLYLGIDGSAPVMPTWSEKLGGPLRVDEVAAVAAFIVNFETWALNPDMIPTPLVEEIDLTDPVSRGRLVYTSNICTACHTLGNLSAGVGGPELNGIGSRAGNTVSGLSAEDYIRESILNPSAFVAEGFVDGLMPTNFLEVLEPEQLEDLIAFLLSLEN